MTNAPARYIKALDENALFRDGAAPFRLDAHTAHALKNAFATAAWVAPDVPRPPAPFLGPTPVGIPTQDAKTEALKAVGLALNDPVLLPGMRRLGRMVPVALELQDGAFDGNWHHDRMIRGHAGAFFLLAYFGETSWDPAWGGGFAYGERDLAGDWAHSVDTPTSQQTVWPAERTAVLGWNENPRLVHRAQPLAAPRKRLTAIIAIDFVLHGA